MGQVFNLFKVNQAIDAVATKFEGVILDHYRAAVWAVFEKLVRTTPQFSGLAAANWNIGIDAPDLSVDYDAHDNYDEVNMRYAGVALNALHTNHHRWVEEALYRNKPKIRKIYSKTHVYITNAVQGDPDHLHGRTSTYYLADLQDPSYWHTRLRDENKPYETVSDVLMDESWRELLRLKGDAVNQRFFV